MEYLNPIHRAHFFPVIKNIKGMKLHDTLVPNGRYEDRFFVDDYQM